MTPEDYNAWYESARGSWIGDTEYRLLRRMLCAQAGATLLDVGCGTGYFSRRFAGDGLSVTGVDPDPATVEFATEHRLGEEFYLIGDALELPFPDKHFDLCVAVTSLCFIEEQERAIGEMLRVTRGHLALGLLNRHSLLYRQKGRGGGRGAYRGAHWHTPAEVRRFFAAQPAGGLEIRSAIFLPGGGPAARAMERVLPSRLSLGGFLAVGVDSTAGDERPR